MTNLVAGKPLSGIAFVDSLIANSYNNTGLIWSADNDKIVRLTFSFTDPDLSKWGNHVTSTTPFTAAEKAAIINALKLYSDIAHVQFTEVSGTSDLRFGKGELVQSGISGISNGIGGDIIISNRIRIDQIELSSSEGMSTIVHEIGHALGLKHPFEGANANTSVYRENSMMAYYYNGNDSFDANVTGLMQTDIDAIQYLYGVNTVATSGNNSYGFTAVAYAEGFTIYDSGGIDTLSYENMSIPFTINLNEEGINTYGGIKAMVIGRGVVIENAIGGNKNDIFIGNNASNVFDGGLGDDTIRYTGDSNEYFIGKTADGYVVKKGLDIDTLLNIEYVKFNNLTIATSSLNINVPVITTGTFTVPTVVTVKGNSYNNTLNGSIRSDVMNGYGGNDIIKGNNGDDIIITSTGKDNIFGGNGADTFVFNTLNPSTVVNDFRNEDQIVLNKNYFTSLVNGITADNVLITGNVITAKDANDYIIYNKTIGYLYYDADGTGSVRPMLVGIIKGDMTDVTFEDFVLGI